MKNHFTFLSNILVCLFLTNNIFAQGNGSDGSLLVTGTTVINTTASAVTGANPIGTTINITSSIGFSVGDVVLIMQMHGTNAGSYDELIITSLTGTSLTFSSPTTVAFSSLASNRAQIIRIPQYTTVTVNSGGTLTAPAWDGNTGGVLIYYANDVVTIDGTVTMDGKGFAGGTGGTGNAAGTATAAGTGGASSGANGSVGTSGTGGAGGFSDAGDGGNGGAGNTALAASPGATGAGSGAGTSGIAGANLSIGFTSLLMGGGGGGGQGGRGGQYGGGGGGGGASSLVALGSGLGTNGTNGTIGTASTAVGGTGGTGGGIILMRTKSLGGSGTIVSNGTNGNPGTGIGGTGGNGGNGGNGGAFLTGLALTNGGGGGGGGRGGQGGQGSGGGGGGGSGVIAITTFTGTAAWTGAMINNPGTGGIGGAGGTSGTSGNGGTGGLGLLLGTSGVAGAPGGVIPPGLTGPTGAPNPLSIPPVSLPVDILAFNGKTIGEAILLEWNTALTESDNHFVVEKSVDGLQYEVLEQSINTVADKNYSLKDNEPSTGKNYYRLRQMDSEGNTSLVKMTAVDYTINLTGIQVFPNPVSNKKVISIRTPEEGGDELLSVEIYSVTGEQLFVTETTLQNEITLPSSLEPGVYAVKVISSLSHTEETEMLVVE